jgi:hypothetical protein
MRGARALGVAITTLALALAVSGCGSPVAVTSPSLATTVAGAPPVVAAQVVIEDIAKSWLAEAEPEQVVEFRECRETHSSQRCSDSGLSSQMCWRRSGATVIP